MLMKKILACVLCFLCLFSLVSCQGAVQFSDLLSTENLAEEALEELDDRVIYVKDKSNFTEEYFKTPDYVRESTVCYAQDTGNINELGVFHVTEGKAEEFSALLKEQYLDASLEKNRDWYDSYIPKETAKLRDAEVRTFGNYVVYAIFDRSERRSIFRTIEDELALGT